MVTGLQRTVECLARMNPGRVAFCLPGSAGQTVDQRHWEWPVHPLETLAAASLSPGQVGQPHIPGGSDAGGTDRRILCLPYLWMGSRSCVGSLEIWWQ